jgi:hypothetical protein
MPITCQGLKSMAKIDVSTEVPKKLNVHSSRVVLDRKGI